jgi:hypothetical protein
LNIRETKEPYHTLTFSVGSKENPCLDASIFMPGIDDRLAHLVEIATIHKIKALEECTIHYDSEKSFGTELLYSFINVLKANYPHVKKINLFDASEIICGHKDTLDLISYSIAKHGKTWYELKVGAYPRDDVEKYKVSVAKFVSPEFKKTVPYEDLFISLLGNKYAEDIMKRSITTYKIMYENANTFPEFFKALNKTVPKEDKCKFFKDWLNEFVGKHVSFMRDWIIDIENNPVLGNVLNISQARPMPPRSRTVKARKNRKQGSRRTRKK